MFTEIKIDDIPQKRRENSEYAEEIRKFLESGIDAAEISGIDIENCNRIYMRYKTHASRIGGVNVIRRKNKVYLIRSDKADKIKDKTD